MESKPSDLAGSPNLQIWQRVQTFRFGRESKPSDLAVGHLITSKSKGLDSILSPSAQIIEYDGVQTFRFGRFFIV
ncbi:MAG: hypothetical protein KAI83_12060 [Thiomargarita sp.]|nr:hypothetical protein [Thiomargarita sp.]